MIEPCNASLNSSMVALTTTSLGLALLAQQAAIRSPRAMFKSSPSPACVNPAQLDSGPACPVEALTRTCSFPVQGKFYQG